MNITDRFTELESMITSFVVDKNIPLFMANTQKNVSIDGENQCIMATMKDKVMYLVAHPDLDIFENFLNLSNDTLQKINEIRQFSFNINEETHVGLHKRLKVTITNKESIEFAIIGSGLIGLTFTLTDNDVSASIQHNRDKGSVSFESIDKIEEALVLSIDQLMSVIINELGFVDCNQHSAPVMDFISKSSEQILTDRFAGLPFNYMPPLALLTSVCDELNVNVDSLLYDENKVKLPSWKKNKVNIPAKLSVILSKSIQKTLSKDEHKINQLISLMDFYYDLIGGENKYNIQFSTFKKCYIGPNNSLDNVYYVLNFGRDLWISIGYNLKPYEGGMYQNINDPNMPESGVSYKFDTRINKKDNHELLNYYTNDMDYIYNHVLTEIKSRISKTLNNNEALTSRDIEVFKMAVY